MLYRILADILLVLHLAWIVFMLWGFVLTVRAFWKPSFFDRWLFRSLHLGGILFVGIWELIGKYCPLTVWEYQLRHLHNPSLEYPGSFIVRHLAELVYPNVDPLVVTLPTMAIVLFTLIVFVVRPPMQLRAALKRKA